MFHIMFYYSSEAIPILTFPRIKLLVLKSNLKDHTMTTSYNPNLRPYLIIDLWLMSLTQGVSDENKYPREGMSPKIRS